jgi:putative phage-type endonuclease
MKVHHDLQQGIPEWHAYRAAHRNASDAPAMMGESAYMTRAELLRRVKTGITPDVDAQTQRRFDDGHRFEALARPLAEAIIGEDLYPVVGSNGLLSASFDGLTMDETIAFEHKSLNEALRAWFGNYDRADIGKTANRAGNELPLMYRIQMQQQIMVSGAERVLFMASKWDGDTLVEEHHCWYFNDEDLAERIRQGWIQFERDLAEYVDCPAAVEMPKPRATTDLPALFIRAKGEITADNMQDYGLKLSEKLQAIRSIALVTDQDFSDAKLAAKQLRENIESAKQAKAAMLAETVTVGEAARMIDAWCEDMRLTALQLEKDVEREDKAKKAAMVAATREKYTFHIASLESEIQPIRLNVAAPAFAEALKNKRNFASMQDALDTMLAGAKISADAAARAIRMNLDCIKTDGAGYEFLFADKAQIVAKAPDDLKLLVSSRIDTHKKAEAAREEATRQRIRAEEQAKAELEARETIAREQREAAALAAKQAQENAIRSNQIDRAVGELSEAATDAKQALAAARDEDSMPPELLKELDGVVDFISSSGIADLSIEKAALKPMPPAPAVVQMFAPRPAAAPVAAPSLRLGQIAERLGFTVTANFLKSLGFDAAGHAGAAVLYHEADFAHICAALVDHITLVQAKQAA